jgi:hypothetical protein
MLVKHELGYPKLGNKTVDFRFINCGKIPPCTNLLFCYSSKDIPFGIHATGASVIHLVLSVI